MKVVILAGGFGTRLGEETGVKPKPMVEIGDKPILWHIMKHYAHHGHREFYIALGYKGDVIKRFFLDYHYLNSSITVNLGTGAVQVHDAEREDWIVHLVDTGLNTQTGGRLRRILPLLGDEPFMLTYGDGVTDLHLPDLVAFHSENRPLATITGVRPPARFGGLLFEGHHIREFTEKPQTGEGWINGGFMVLEPGIGAYLKGDSASLEADALHHVAADGRLCAYRHDGFWQCMDTMRDKQLLEQLWREDRAAWKVWT